METHPEWVIASQILRLGQQLAVHSGLLGQPHLSIFNVLCTFLPAPTFYNKSIIGTREFPYCVPCAIQSADIYVFHSSLYNLYDLGIISPILQMKKQVLRD